ncbi:MAG: type II toxin-antitoxin system RelE/ParE family toxin [Rhodothalassiaceae bacterium]
MTLNHRVRGSSPRRPSTFFPPPLLYPAFPVAPAGQGFCKGKGRAKAVISDAPIRHVKAREDIGGAVYVAVKGRRIVVLHAFVKKSRATPRRALETARQRLKEMERG